MISNKVDLEVIKLIDSQKLTCEEYDSNPFVSFDDDGRPRSRFTDDLWDYNQYNPKELSPPSLYRITWNEDKHNLSLLNDLKRRASIIMKIGSYTDELNIDRKVITHKTLCAQMSNIERMMRAFKGTNIHNMASFSHPLIFEMLKDVIRDFELAPQTIEGLLSSFTTIEYANPHLPEEEQLVFDFNRNEIAKSLSNGSSKGHTPVVIPEIYSTVLSIFIKTIEDAKKSIKKVPNTREYARKKSITEYDAYKEKEYITGICFMALMAFTGMRLSEVVRLHRNSYLIVYALGIEISVLKGSTIKLEGGNDRDDIWCCAPICETAIEILDLLWRDERDYPDNIMAIPVYTYLKEGRISKTFPNRKLNTGSVSNLTMKASDKMNITYESEWDINYLLLNSKIRPNRDPRKMREDGTQYWHLSNHAWRRTFAHFAVGNGLLSLASVKQQFKHVFIGMTGIYSASSDVITLLGIKEDKTLMKEIKNAKKHYTSEYLADTFGEYNLFSGGFAKSILGDDKAKVLTEERFQQLEESSYTASKSTGYGRCFSKEKCSMKHIFEPSGCVSDDCENLSINENEALRWKQRHKRSSDSLSKMFASGFINNNVLARELCDIRAAEKVLTDHNIQFKVYEMTI